MRLARLPPWARTGLVFALVLGVLRPSLLLNFPDFAVAPVWPPSGVALACLVVLGRSTWPGVALGTLVSEVIDRSTPGMALLQVVVTTGEAVLASSLLRLVRFDPTLTRRRDVFSLIVLGAVIPAIPLSAIATTGLLAFGGLPVERAPLAFAMWSTGDAIGVLTVAPFLLVAASTRPLVPRTRWLEALLLLTSLLVLGVLVFLPVLGYSHAPLTYVFVPFVLWSAVRLGPLGSSTAVLLITVLATAGTAIGQGPLAVGAPSTHVGLAQLFLVVISMVGLLVAAAESERKDALRRREEFLSLASHELKTPLTPLRVGLQLMKGHPERAPELVDRSLRQLDRLNGLVDSLLDVSRLGRGTLTVMPGEVNLGALVREVVRKHEPAARAAGCTVELRLEDGLVGWWDRARLEQVVGALLGNAFKYAAGTAVEIAARRAGPHARLEVRDRGAGIAPGDLERIFGEFERGRTDRALGGLGLGLFLARQVVEAHGGALTAEPHAGQGALFVVELPFERAGRRHRFWLEGLRSWRRLVPRPAWAFTRGARASP